jgi:DNA polymerase-3 subunit gamma/tau
MLEVVDELERSGHNLQHFSRELSRYFRNLLVARISGPGAGSARLIAASAAQRQKLAEIAAGFSEEDLTRYLQLSLDLFRDLQFSLQPRFHLEIGLVRLVQAGRLLPIEQALADLKNGGAAPRPVRPSGGGAPPAPPAPSAPPARQAEGEPQQQLHAHLSQKGLTHLADAVENSRVTIAGLELQVVTAKSYKLYFDDKQFAEAVREVFGRPLRIQVTIGAGGEPVAAMPSAASQTDDATSRALANPEVRRFREVFGGEVRRVRNLKE